MSSINGYSSDQGNIGIDQERERKVKEEKEEGEGDKKIGKEERQILYLFWRSKTSVTLALGDTEKFKKELIRLYAFIASSIYKNICALFGKIH